MVLHSGKCSFWIVLKTENGEHICVVDKAIVGTGVKSIHIHYSGRSIDTRV